MDNNNPITLASLGDALVALVASGAGSPIEAALAAYKATFDTYCQQPAEIDQAAILDLKNELTAKDATIKQYDDVLKEAKVIIADLKKQLADAAETKAALSDKPTFELDGENYKIVHGAYPHSVEDLAGDIELCKEVLKIEGQNAIVKI